MKGAIEHGLKWVRHIHATSQFFDLFMSLNLANMSHVLKRQKVLH